MTQPFVLASPVEGNFDLFDESGLLYSVSSVPYNDVPEGSFLLGAASDGTAPFALIDMTAALVPVVAQAAGAPTGPYLMTTTRQLNATLVRSDGSYVPVVAQAPEG